MQICLMENVLHALYNKIAKHANNRINIIRMGGNGILGRISTIHFNL